MPSERIDTVGADHVMLGSDMPFDMGADDPVERIETAHVVASAQTLQA